MLPIDLSSKVALITGGTRGIGRGIADTLARAGASVVVASRHLAECESTAEQLRQEHHVPALGVRVDVSQPEEIRAMVRQVVHHFSRLDVMVSNAGIAARSEAFDITPEVWNAVLNTNLRGNFFCAQEAAKVMKEHNGGVSSISDRSTR